MTIAGMSNSNPNLATRPTWHVDIDIMTDILSCPNPSSSNLSKIFLPLSPVGVDIAAATSSDSTSTTASSTYVPVKVFSNADLSNYLRKQIWW